MQIIIIRAQSGDREAFAALFEQYKNLVYKTVYLLLGDVHEADDALQEVFLSVHKSLPSFDPHKGAFAIWLYRVTLNFCLNHRRRKNHASLEDISPVPAIHFPGAQLAPRRWMVHGHREGSCVRSTCRSRIVG